MTLRHDVGYDLVYYLEENQDASPASGCSRSSSATTPTEPAPRTCSATSARSPKKQLKEPRYKASNRATRSARKGSSTPTTKYLRGEPGLTRIQVNALGQPTPGGQLVSEPPMPGDNLKLTIDSDVQEAGESALASHGLPGAFVTMNVHNGEILGMGSSPTFDPTVFTKPTQAQVNDLYRDDVRRRSPTARPKATTRPARPSR